MGETCWRSQTLDLAQHPGQWLRVVPKMEQPVTVRLRVTDEQGKPVHPAVSVYDTNGYVDWTKPSRYAAATVSSGMLRRHFACADLEGCIT
jgi:hypothetical protein